MSAPVTVTLTPRAKIITLNMISGRLDSLRRWRSERVNANLTVRGLDEQIGDLRELRAQILQPQSRPVDDERSERAVSASIARVQAALEAAE